jgi:hypothetical protein
LTLNASCEAWENSCEARKHDENLPWFGWTCDHVQVLKKTDYYST